MPVTKESPSREFTRTGLANRIMAGTPRRSLHHVAVLPGSQARSVNHFVEADKMLTKDGRSWQREIEWSGRGDFLRVAMDNTRRSAGRVDSSRGGPPEYSSPKTWFMCQQPGMPGSVRSIQFPSLSLYRGAERGRRKAQWGSGYLRVMSLGVATAALSWAQAREAGRPDAARTPCPRISGSRCCTASLNLPPQMRPGSLNRKRVRPRLVSWSSGAAWKDTLIRQCLRFPLRHPRQPGRGVHPGMLSGTSALLVSAGVIRVRTNAGQPVSSPASTVPSSQLRVFPGNAPVVDPAITLRPAGFKSPCPQATGKQPSYKAWGVVNPLVVANRPATGNVVKG